MLAGKVAAYVLTSSAAILSDAAESVIHVAAVSFATFSLWLSTKPPDKRFPFGYERITFFSAGFEGALIVLAAIGIIAVAIQKWLQGLPLQRLGEGTMLVLLAALLNAGLGYYLVRVGKKNRSLILEANGRHVLTDSLTSFGVVGGLVLVLVTGWKPFDPICAIAVALNILWSGSRLLWRSVGGLLDYTDPELRDELQASLEPLCRELGIRCHGLRFRDAGHRLLIEVHLLFPQTTTVGEAHRTATEFERRLSETLRASAEVTTHLESLEDHAVVHEDGHPEVPPE
jgi:cation diffusion facilitator family transporter